ncbi:MAG: flagellin [Anaerolineae bacterium]
MFNTLHKNERGQTALETAIILIAFIVVASVFAFTILSAGTASTERGEQAIAAGLENVQSSMSIKGKVLAQDNEATPDGNINDVLVTLGLVAGGEPVNLGAGALVVSYRDATQIDNAITWTANWLAHNDGATADDLLEEGELVELEISVAGLTNALAENTEFTLEIKPQSGAVLNINRTTPAAIEPVMEL